MRCSGLVVLLLSLGFLACALEPKPSDLFRGGELDKLPYVTTSSIAAEGEHFYLEDLNGDGEPERLLIAKGGAGDDIEKYWFINIRPFYHGEAEGTQEVIASGINYIDIELNNIDMNPGKEIILTYTEGDTILLDIYKYSIEKGIDRIMHKEILRRDEFGIKHSWEGSYNIQAFAEMNGDDIPDILGSYSAGVDLIPRGLLAIDPSSGEHLWRYPLGTMVRLTLVEDIDANGSEDIIISTNSPNNPVYQSIVEDGCEYAIIGSSAATYVKYSDTGDLLEFQKELPIGDRRIQRIEGEYFTSDDSSYVIRLSKTGKLVWKVARGGGHSTTWCRLIDFDGDEHYDIVTWTNHSGKDSTKNNIISILNREDGSEALRSSPLSAPVRDVKVVQLDSKRSALVAIDKDGNGIIFDDKLRLKLKCYLPEIKGLTSIADINQDRASELILLTLNDDIVITDQDFNPLTFIEGPVVYLSDIGVVDYRDTTSIYISRGKIKQHVILIPQQPLLTLWKNNWQLIVLTSGFFFVCILSYFYRRKCRKDCDNNILALFDKIPMAVAWFDNNGNFAGANQKLIKMFAPDLNGDYFFEVGNISELKERWDCFRLNSHNRELFNWDTHIEKVPKQFEVTMFQISDSSFASYYLLISENVGRKEWERAVIWAGVAQKISHKRIKGGLQPIISAAYRIKKTKHPQDEDYALAERIVNASESIKNDTARLMRLLKPDSPNLRWMDINEVVINLLQGYKDNAPSDIEIKSKLSTDEFRVMADNDSLQEAINVIIINAIEVLDEGGMISISTYMAQDLLSVKSDYGVIEIRDTGHGIPEEDIKTIFQLGYTTKKDGSGFGLAFAKQVVEDLGGRISVSSKLGEGTVFTLKIPLQRKDR
ncbi:MAG: hypothetical protein GF315_14625 [candidate division Zixibacteria bacterium]|nr:hypothetical protein [candidate division Zixibacteria bacterium]